MPDHIFSPREVDSFHQDGFLRVNGFFSAEEIEKLYTAALADLQMQNNALDLHDSKGNKTRLSLWFTPGNDVFGYLSRSRRMVSGADQLMAGTAPVCHFHSKLMQKQPRVGGAWEWHQDYGYWYKNSFMFPDEMLSIMIALTPASKANGCLQVIKGSHKMGRVNHGFSGEQVGADMTMVDYALKTMPVEYAELNPGDALFFHSNLLHRSEANLSEHPRWSVISCYNRQSNFAYNETSTAWKVPVNVVPDEAVLEWESEERTEGDFLKKEDDPALK